ncbi:AraC family transcriptional regulator [Oscillatoria sp. CS-180]|uniref:AraC family transcriptional regulator n=1 Tax=Oscillatoria sp. CS-180 TaxID=3021720 RepID=UPI00232EFDEE|nr:AraC family transcriptional regulator [Oscillatoria sp. CS-180]MDB9529424.1 AraC family transcriptional regulator [Oscillatoria sp. CS-180]
MHKQVDSTRLWRSHLPGIELFEAQLFRHRFGKHFHDAYTIGLNEQGQGRSLHHGENRCLHVGSFNLINPGEVHTGQVVSVETGWAFRNIYIEVEAIAPLLAQLEWSQSGLPYFKAAIGVDQQLRSRFYTLFNALTQPTSVLMQQSLLLELLSDLFCRYSDTAFEPRALKPESKAIAVVRSYLAAHYAEPISLDALAALVSLNPHYLVRCFHKQVGCPPHQYQRHCQLAAAKRALRSSVAIAAIAADHGFYDQSHFNREFKRVFGVTPGHYQKVNSVQYR